MEWAGWPDVFRVLVLSWRKLENTGFPPYDFPELMVWETCPGEMSCGLACHLINPKDTTNA